MLLNPYRFRPGIPPAVRSFIDFKNGLTDYVDSVAWTPSGNAAVETSAYDANTPILKLHQGTGDALARNFAWLAAQEITFEMWARIISFNADGYGQGLMFLRDAAGLSVGFALSGSPSSILNAAQVWAGAPGYNGANTELQVNAVTLNHFMVTRDSTGLCRYFVNGVKAATEFAGINTTFNHFLLGYIGWTYQFPRPIEIRAFRATEGILQTGNFTPPAVPSY